MGGAVKRLNSIGSNSPSLTMAPRRCFVVNGLKREELIATNSMILHECYLRAWAAMAACLRESSRPARPRTSARWKRWRAEFTAMGKALGGGSDGCFSSGQTAATGS